MFTKVLFETKKKKKKREKRERERENNTRKEKHERAQVFRSFDAVRTRTTDAAQRLPLSTATTHARHALHFLNLSQIFFLDYIILHTYVRWHLSLYINRYGFQ